MNLKSQIKIDVYESLKEQIDLNEIIVENPKDYTLGDYAIPCFVFAKKLKKSPSEIANYIKENINNNCYEKLEIVNGYLNIFIKKRVLIEYVIDKIIKEKDNYGNNNIGENLNIVIDYSSPNIAKPFSVGHLRTTVIGNSLKNIIIKNGYNVIGINHLGDWGTQFGKLIYAYKNWGDEKKVKENPIFELTELYVKFHEEALKNPLLEEEARKYFKALEDGDEEALILWKWFVDESLKEFKKTYQLLGIGEFDYYTGESFFNDKMQDVIDELKAQNLLKISEGATIVDLDDLPPALITKSDGATLYITRDLATALYRKKIFDFAEALYVVGREQTLHFKQLKSVLNKMGCDFEKNIHHISFGMVLQDGKKMSTRKGRNVRLHDVLLEAIEMAKKHISQNRDVDIIKVSHQVGIGAVIFNDLKNYRTHDIEFVLNDILNFNGETGPYIQYTYARIMSLLKKKENINIDYNKIIIDEFIWNLIFKLYEFPEIVIKAKEDYDPSLIAKYSMSLAQDFNKFYANEKIIDDNINNKAFKLLVCETVSIVLKESFRLLGIEMPDKM